MSHPVTCIITSSCFVYRETANIPLIALGLKETKEVDFSTPFKVHKQQWFHSRFVLNKTYTNRLDIRQKYRLMVKM